MEKRVRPLAEQLGRRLPDRLRRLRHGQSRPRVRDAEGALADDRLPRPRDRLFRQERAARPFVDTSLDNFLLTMNISAYSFVAVAQRAAAMMPDGGALLTLSYYGAEKVIPHYNVMGVAKAALETSVKYLAMDLGPDNIRVNAISAGPIKTLAASGIGDFRYILKWNEYNSPLRRNVTIEDVGGAGLYLLSDLASRRDRRDPPCRRRLQRDRHEGRGRAGHQRGLGPPSGPMSVNSFGRALPLHDLGRKPRAGDRRAGRRLPAGPRARRGRHPAVARQAAARRLARLTSPRAEPDRVRILSGVYRGAHDRDADQPDHRQCRRAARPTIRPTRRPAPAMPTPPMTRNTAFATRAAAGAPRRGRRRRGSRPARWRGW